MVVHARCEGLGAQPQASFNLCNLMKFCLIMLSQLNDRSLLSLMGPQSNSIISFSV